MLLLELLLELLLLKVLLNHRHRQRHLLSVGESDKLPNSVVLLQFLFIGLLLHGHLGLAALRSRPATLLRSFSLLLLVLQRLLLLKRHLILLDLSMDGLTFVRECHSIAVLGASKVMMLRPRLPIGGTAGEAVDRVGNSFAVLRVRSWVGSVHGEAHYFVAALVVSCSQTLKNV